MAPPYAQAATIANSGYYTFASLPPASQNVGDYQYTSDLGPVWSNGIAWAVFTGGGTSTVISSATALQSFIAGAGASPAAASIATPISLPTSITTPTNIQLAFVGNGKLVPANGTTATVNSFVNAGPFQIFDTSLGGTVTGAVRNEEIPVEWFGAAADGATVSGGFINNALAMALAAGTSARCLGGTYLTHDATLALGGVSFTRPSLLGCSKKQTILNYSAAGANFIGIKIRGGSGQVTGDSIRDMTLVGHSTSIGVENNGACGSNIDNCLFGANAVAIQCHNETAGSFTEFCTATRCEQSTACSKFWTYKVTAGNNSFHGSGPGGGIDNLVQCGASQTTVIHALGTNTFVYHAPCNLQVFCTSSNVTIFQNDNSVAPVPLCYWGHLDIETNSGRTTTLGGGAQVLFVGPVRPIGATNLTGDNIVAGTFLRIDTYQGHADSSISYTGARAGRKYALTIPSASTAGINVSGPMNTVCRAVDINIFATNFTKRNSLIADFFGDGTTSVGPINLGTHASFDNPGGSLGYQSPTFSGSPNGSYNIVVPTVSKTASGAFAGGETTVSFSPSWQSPTGTYNCTFSNGDVRAIAMTVSSGGPYTFSPALSSAATTALTFQTWPVGSGVFTAYVQEVQQSNGIQASGHTQY